MEKTCKFNQRKNQNKSSIHFRWLLPVTLCNSLHVLIKTGFPQIFNTAIIVFCFIKRYFFIFTDCIVTMITSINTVCSMHQAFYIWNHLPTGHSWPFKYVGTILNHFLKIWRFSAVVFTDQHRRESFKIASTCLLPPTHFSQFLVVYILIWTLRPFQSIWYNGTFILNETYHAPNGSLSKVGVGGKSKFVILNPLNGFGWKSRLFSGILIVYIDLFIWVKMTSVWVYDVLWVMDKQTVLDLWSKLVLVGPWFGSWNLVLDQNKHGLLNSGLRFVWTNQSRILITKTEESAGKVNFECQESDIVMRYTLNTLFRILSKLFPYLS